MKKLMCAVGVVAMVLGGSFMFGESSALAKNKKVVALPAAVLDAKTVFVQNETTEAELQNSAYMELMKWGRFQIVDNAGKADMVLRLSGTNTVKFVAGENAASTYGPSASAMFAPGDEVPAGYTRVELVGPKHGNVLWSDLRKTKGSKLSAKLLDGLREAFEQQERGKWNN
jgi:hypothetical protein